MACQIEAVAGVKAEGQVLTRMDEVVRADQNRYRERAVYARVIRRGE